MQYETEHLFSFQRKISSREKVEQLNNFSHVVIWSEIMPSVMVTWHVSKRSKTTVPINSICAEIDCLQIKRTYLSSNWLVGIIRGINVHYLSWIHLTLIPTCTSQIHSCDWHWAEAPPLPPHHTVTGQAERRSSMSWRGSCVYSLFYSLLRWMNPRVKEATKKPSGSLKSLDVAPVQ